MPSSRGVTPRVRVERECERIGTDEVVRRCVAVLTGMDVDEGFLIVIGGPGARSVLNGREGGVTGYWPRTWAARALLYAWDDTATPAVRAATTDEAWRVREMAAKVIARHRLDEGLETVSRLVTDPNPRVRAAATRARQRLTQAGWSGS